MCCRAGCPTRLDVWRSGSRVVGRACQSIGHCVIGDKHHRTSPHKYLPSSLYLSLDSRAIRLSSSNQPEYYPNLFTFLTNTMSGRAVPALGALAAGGIGYYLYTAGGDPKLAEKKAERTFLRITQDVT
jgi:hypothetical protein